MAASVYVLSCVVCEHGQCSVVVFGGATGNAVSVTCGLLHNLLTNVLECLLERPNRSWTTV
jgi:hypothetical protein